MLGVAGHPITLRFQGDRNELWDDTRSALVPMLARRQRAGTRASRLPFGCQATSRPEVPRPRLCGVGALHEYLDRLRQSGSLQ
jgi:hypothetical protein